MKFKKVKLSDISINNKGHYGIGASAVNFDPNLPTYLRISDIKDDGSLNKTDLKSIDETDYDNFILKENDIVFARTGNSTGRNYFYEKKDGEFVFAGFLIKFSLDERCVYPKFIKYYCQTDQYWGWVNSIATGSTRKNINAKMYENMPVDLPDDITQRKIVSLLEKFDQKIEINNKIIDNLEVQAQAIFKSWFVDFEPFQDGEFVESELGLIPKGFKVIKLGDLYPIKSGYAFKSKDWSENGVPIIKIKNIDSGTVDFSDADYIDDKSVLESASNFEVNGKEIVMALTGATTGKFGVIPLGTNAYVNQRVGLFFDKLQIGYGILYGILNQKNMIKNIIELSQGSAQSNLSPNDVNNIKIAYSEECEDISELLNYFLENISITLFQNKKLAELRDALLPKLMSGEIDVSNIDILGEEVRDE